MKRCRHCGVDNDDLAAVCSECGLDFSPSPGVRLITKAASVARRIDPRWGRWILTAAGLMLLLGALYVFSFGPVLWICGGTPQNPWGNTPRIIRAVYEPLDRARLPQPLRTVTPKYTRWWLGPDRDSGPLRGQLVLADQSITNGMMHAHVIELLGRPDASVTNGLCVEHDFLSSDPSAYARGCTNGLAITFSNGTVVAKRALVPGR